MAALRSRLRTLPALLAAVGLLAASWLGGGGGAARAAVGSATGPLVGDSAGDGAILAASDLGPGQSRSGEVTVSNVGDESGDFALTPRDLVDTPSSTPLSGVLDLVVEDVSGAGPTLVYAGRLADLGAVALGTLAQGEARRYRFTVDFPAGRSAALDDPYQGASSSVTFVWTATGAEAAAASAPEQTVQAAAGTPSTVAGAPRPSLSARARQTVVNGAIVASVTCASGCRATVAGSATAGRTKVALRPVSLTVERGRERVRVPLPRRTRAAVSAGATATVRLRLTATAGGRVTTATRTVRVTRPGG
jgi:hypothetical protein